MFVCVCAHVHFCLAAIYIYTSLCIKEIAGRKILETDSNTRSCATVQCIQMDRAEDGHASIPVIPEHKNWQYRSDAVSRSLGFPGDAVGKNPPAIAGNAGLISGSGRSPGAGNDCPLQYSCLENWMDRGAWWATVHGVTKSPTRLSTQARPHEQFSWTR